MQERGARPRRGRGGGDGWNPTGSSGANLRFWQVLAVVAIIVATAGWTTVVVMNTNDGGGVAEPTAAATDNSTDPSIVLSHTFPQLEASLPTRLSGTALTVESWSGDAIFGTDPWSQSFTAYLATVGKTPADVQVAQAYDAAGSIDSGAAAYQVDGISAPALRDAMIAAWKVQYPDLVISDITLGGKSVTKGLFGADVPDSYWYISGDVVFDVETSGEALATTVLAALPEPGAPSASPSGSPAPTPSPS